MMKKIKCFFMTFLDKVKNNYKNIIAFFLPIIIALFLLIPVDYYITIGGGVISIDDSIKVENEKDGKGSFNSAYVSQTKGTIISYLLSFIIDDFEREKIEDIVINNEDIEAYKFREEMMFKSSLSNATKVAYESAGKDIVLSNNSFKVIYVDSYANTDILVGDEIIKVDNILIKDMNKIREIIFNKEVGESINILVRRDDKEIEVSAKIYGDKLEKKIGIALMNDFSYKTTPKIEFDFSGREAGSSGGLIMSLSIYNKLVDKDITKGYKIVGTGTIEYDGSVGEIGGVKYKLMGAVKDKADVFLVPVDNYEEAKRIVDESDYDIKLIKVSSFNDAISKLNQLG